ncbi:MAG: hypothetical protein ACO1RA_02205 [Planctomycetaceae bacterium]
MKRVVRTIINSYSHDKQLKAYYFLACTFPEVTKPSFNRVLECSDRLCDARFDHIQD